MNPGNTPPATPRPAGQAGSTKSDLFQASDCVLLNEGGIFMRNGSGALMLAYVAVGRLIGYFEPHINSWDALAGFLLVREAGGWTSDLLANDGLTRGNMCAAAAPALAPKLQAMLAKTVPNPSRP